ncbi:unnamed protein product [Closterium sp. Yama58-4]|nr:unnamed protein product [Closterium sp. Yama58-4]
MTSAQILRAVSRLPYLTFLDLPRGAIVDSVDSAESVDRFNLADCLDCVDPVDSADSLIRGLSAACPQIRSLRVAEQPSFRKAEEQRAESSPADTHALPVISADLLVALSRCRALTHLRLITSAARTCADNTAASAIAEAAAEALSSPRASSAEGSRSRGYSGALLPRDNNPAPALDVLHVSDPDHFSYLSPALPRLTCLRQLHVSNVSSLPEALSTLRQLSLLDINAERGFQSLPDALFSNLPVLETFRIRGASELISLPETLGALTSLEDLLVQSCGVESLPASLGNLGKLTSLVLVTCKQLLQLLPESISGLRSLQRLRVSECPRLAPLPDCFQQMVTLREPLTLLKYLKLSSTRTSLPPWLGYLPSLQHITLSSCWSLQQLPPSLPLLSPSLQTLHIHQCNSLTSLPEDFGQLTSLQHLEIRNCPALSQLPNSFPNLSSLQSLDLSSCGNLTSLPRDFGQLTALKLVRLACLCKLVELPESVGQLSQLQSFEIQGCPRITILPPLSQCISLNLLHVANCKSLSSLPSDLHSLLSLHSLYLLSCPALSSLPENLGQLPELSYLEIRSCRSLVSLPASLSLLSTLSSLKIAWCSKLTSLTPRLDHLISLTSLSLIGLPSLRTPPPSPSASPGRFFRRQLPGCFPQLPKSCLEEGKSIPAPAFRIERILRVISACGLAQPLGIMAAPAASEGHALGAASSTQSTHGTADQAAPEVASSTSAAPATSAPEKAAQGQEAGVPSLHDISDHSSEEGDNDRDSSEEKGGGGTPGAAADREKEEQGAKETAEAIPNGNGSTNGIAFAKEDSGAAADASAAVAVANENGSGDGNGPAKPAGLLATWRRKAERLFPGLLGKGENREGGDGDDEGSSRALVPAAAAGVPALPQVVVEDPPLVPRGSYWAVFQAFFLLGWTAFGGPSAHIAMYHKQFVELRGWMSEDVFAELLALTQAVPGPSSTQMSFSIGILQKGITGGLLSGALFQFPGALIMAIAGFGVAKFLIDPAPWLSALSAGLAAVAVALVAEAAVILGKKMCRNKVTRVLCVASAVITFYYATQWIFPTVILLGGVVTYFTERNKPIPPQRSDIQRLGVSPLVGAMLLFAWIAILVGSIVYKNATSYESAKWIHWFEVEAGRGVSPLVGGMLLFAWVAILVGSIVYKNATSYESAKWIHWFEVRVWASV